MLFGDCQKLPSAPESAREIGSAAGSAPESALTLHKKKKMFHAEHHQIIQSKLDLWKILAWPANGCRHCNFGFPQKIGFASAFRGPIARICSITSREEQSMDQYRSRLKLSENFERHWSILISGEIHMDQALVPIFSWGNSYGPMVLKVLLKFPPNTGIGPWMALPRLLMQRVQYRNLSAPQRCNAQRSDAQRKFFTTLSISLFLQRHRCDALPCFSASPVDIFYIAHIALRPLLPFFLSPQWFTVQNNNKFAKNYNAAMSSLATRDGQRNAQRTTQRCGALRPQ